jgi:GH24 family phage-related lysozyme (muramidase)
MKTLLVRLQFKLASWLYNQGIIAPQLLEHKIIRVMNDEEMEDRQKSLNFWNSLSKDMKL